MWELGHLGIGSKIASPFSKRLSYGWLLFGTVLPDLVDKPLYYGLSIFTGKIGSGLGLISCTRTFGHSGLLLGAFALVAWKKRSPLFKAIALGMATHLLLDGAQDFWTHIIHRAPGESASWLATFFPFPYGAYDPRFAIMPFTSMTEHLKTGEIPHILATEILGAGILAWDYFKPSRYNESGERIPRAARSGSAGGS